MSEYACYNVPIVLALAVLVNILEVCSEVSVIAWIINAIEAFPLVLFVRIELVQPYHTLPKLLHPKSPDYIVHQE